MALRTGVLRCTAARRMRRSLDASLVGQDLLKHGVLLGLVAGEHVFIEGQPGCGKTMAAEVAARASQLSTFFYQFHRDTRVSELVGHTVVHRQRGLRDAGLGPGCSGARTEVVQIRTVAGGVLTAEVCVLDDITRAPGEALNVLLRILEERKYGSAPIPLVSAIATANPPDEAFYTDPIDPATLDRFAVQLRVDGLIAQHDWSSVAQVFAHPRPSVSGSSGPPGGGDADARVVAGIHSKPDDSGGSDTCNSVNSAMVESAVAAAEFATARAAARATHVPPRVQRLLLRVLQVLRDSVADPVSDGSDEAVTNSMTDRAFLVKALRLIQAQAHVMGRTVAIPNDLHVLVLLSTFRLPDIHAEVPAIIQRVIESEDDAEFEPPPPPPPLDESEEAGAPPRDDGGEDGEDDDRYGSEPSDDGGGDTEGESDDDTSKADNNNDSSSSGQTPPSDEPPQEHDVGGRAQPVSSDGSNDDDDDDGDGSSLPSVSSIVNRRPDEDGLESDARHFSSLTCDNVEVVLKVLRGRIERGRAQSTPHRGGQPRSFSRPDDFGDFDDADPIETLEWLRNPVPLLPRRLERFRTDRSGSLALLRDTSMSMTGVWNEWAESLSLRIIDLCRSQRMRIGYLEFNHKLKKVSDNRDGFFMRDHNKLSAEVRQAVCSGVTDYQLPLLEALQEFRESNSRRHDRHIVFLTDGLPTAGCTNLKAEISLAQDLGVSVHTLFIGSKPYPDLLSALAESTHGVQFRATYDHGVNTITVTTRRPGEQEFGLTRTIG